MFAPCNRRSTPTLSPSLIIFIVLLCVICNKCCALSSTLNRRDAIASVGQAAIIGVSGAAALSFDDDESRMAIEVPSSAVGAKNPYKVSVPRIGYSLYKTPVDQVQRCIELALAAGVRHYDVATQYGSNEVIGEALQQYLGSGPFQVAERQRKRKELFVHHKVSNQEQSTSLNKVKKAVKTELHKLRLGYLDMCSIHSPLSNPELRLGTYEALLELQKDGIVRAVGVCNYGVNPLGEKTCRRRLVA